MKWGSGCGSERSWLQPTTTSCPFDVPSCFPFDSEFLLIAQAPNPTPKTRIP